MEFESLESWLDDVMPQVPGCSKYTVLDSLRLAAIEFCRKAGVSVETTEELDVEAGEREFAIPSPSSKVRVLNLLWAETTLGPLDILDRRSMNARGVRVNHAERTASWPRALKRVTRDLYHFDPIPEEDHPSAVTVHVSYLPKEDADKVDGVLFEDYREAIGAGALSRLLGQSGMPWANEPKADRYEREFRYQINNAAAHAAKDFTTAPQYLVLRPLA